MYAIRSYYAKEYPDVHTDKFHIDILTANFVRRPDWFDVVVASNLFGDILSLSTYDFSEAAFGEDQTILQMTREVTDKPLMICGKIFV